MIKLEEISRGTGTEHAFELFVQPSPTCYTQCANKLFEINHPILVLVKHVEDVVRELSRISKGEELLVYATELDLVELTGRAVF